MADRRIDGPSLLWPGVLVGIGIIQLVERRHTTPDPPRLALALALAAALALTGALLLRPTRQPSS